MEYCVTPYDGKRRVYGWFACYNCFHEWESPCSWANMCQICRYCYEKTFPYRQKILNELAHYPDEMETKHPQELCEMCYYIKENCTDYFEMAE